MQTAIEPPAPGVVRARRRPRPATAIVPERRHALAPSSSRAASASSTRPGRSRAAIGDRAPEAAAERGAARAREVRPRHAPARRAGGASPSTSSSRRVDRRAAVEAGRRSRTRPSAAPDRQRGGQRALELGDEVGAHERGNLSLRAHHERRAPPTTRAPMAIARGPPGAATWEPRARGRRRRTPRPLRTRLPRPAQAVPLRPRAGRSTMSVGAMADGTVLSRELRGDALRLRAAGMDWPLQGLTMVGLRPPRRPPGVRGVRGRRRRGGRPDRGGRVARRRVDPHARDARRARRRAHGVGGRLLPGLPEADAPDDGSLDLRDVRLPRGAARRGARELRAPGLRGARALRGRASSSETLPPLAGPPLGDRPPRRRHLRGDADWRCAASTPASRRRAPDPRRLRLVRGLPARGRRVPQRARRSPSRSRRSTGPARAGGARATTPIELAPVRAARPSAPRPTAARGAPAHVPSARELELAREVAALRERLAAARGAVGRAPGCGAGWAGARRDDRLRARRSPSPTPTSAAPSRASRSLAEREADSEVMRHSAAGLDLPLATT